MGCQHNLFLYLLKLKSLYQIDIIFSNPFSLIPHPSLLSKLILHGHDYHGQALKNLPTKFGGLLFPSIFFFLNFFCSKLSLLMYLFIVIMLGNGLDCYNGNVYTIKLLLKKKKIKALTDIQGEKNETINLVLHLLLLFYDLIHLC